MAMGRPLFPGSSVEDQLARIFKIMGSPDDQIWPQMSELPQYQLIENMPKYPEHSLAQLIPKLDSAGIELLNMLLEYQPERRISAEKAVQRKEF